ncbi:Endonuclease/exonuclease/phosphatase [Dichomitus squalens]|uniref:DNA-(apurinic or apyrimidinic site) endonuclease n=1 Tax=Dichomitus squalens TaxID=114155 RepID=A0A4Q9NZY4_9APHY|nr:Endonuclease/exonuclease/phosphatase [Dichomitus squalens]TBU60561.1 Endonuclease/exonuclease/phosphatase [Dichomitus squalens]
MRILSWNINGIRTLPKYHPWNTFKTCEGILDEINADIICFQEMKSSRANLPRDVALPGPYHSFFSFPTSKGGYSGVAVYVDSRKVTPLKAEEGLSGKLQPNPPLSAEERISPSYPSPHDVDLYADEEGAVPASFDALDGEGRALVLDFGLFVLVNVYCPAETSEGRLPFKMNFHLLLQERVRRLVEDERREVVVLGDINVCAAPIDHCDGHLPSTVAAFYDHPARAWFRRWIGPDGPMTDVIRQFHPDRKGLFTCWNTRIQARETNYGTRIDYVLVTRGLLPWISAGDIQPALKGSDHCPVYVDLRDEITLASGETIALRDAMKQTPGLRDPPRTAARYWDEFSARQMVLSAFFGKGAAAKTKTKTGGDTARSASPAPTPAAQGSSTSAAAATSTATSTPTPSAASLDAEPDHTPLADPPVKKLKPAQARPPSQPTTTRKRKASDNPPASKKRKAAPAKRQPSIAAFFSKPAPSPSTSAAASASSTRPPPEVIDVDGEDEDENGGGPSTLPPSDRPVPRSSQPPADADQDQIDADYRLALALAATETAPDDLPSPASSQPPSRNNNDDHSNSNSNSNSSSSNTEKEKAAAWSSLFAPVQPPRCTVHDEPARLYTVNKPGPNRGKTFYLCARPVGPGYDKGRGERLREEVDHRYRCNYFKWASEARREAKAKKARAQGS